MPTSFTGRLGGRGLDAFDEQVADHPALADGSGDDDSFDESGGRAGDAMVDEGVGYLSDTSHDEDPSEPFGHQAGGEGDVSHRDQP